MINAIWKYNQLSKVTKAAIWFTICNCISSGVSFLSMPFFTRLMSSNQYGILTVYNSWVQLFAVFATLNLAAGAFNNGMVRFPNYRNEYSSSMQGLVFVTTGVVAAITVALMRLFPNIMGMQLEMVLMMFIQLFSNGIYSLWSARQRYEYGYIKLVAMTFVYSICVTVLALIAVWAVPDDRAKASAKIIASAMGSLMLALVLIVVTQRKSFRPCCVLYWKYALLFSIPLIPHYLSLIVLGQIDRIMISNMIGDEAAAHYAVAYNIGLAVSVLSSALNSSMVPWQFEKIRNNDIAGLSSRITALVVVISFVGVAVSLISPEILYLAAPSEYQDAVYVMPPVAMGIIFTYIYNILSNYEFYYEANKFISIASMIAAVLNIMLNALLLPIYGYMAAAYTTMVCYGLLAVGHTIFSWKVCKDNVGVKRAEMMLDPKHIWIIACIAMLMMLLISVMYGYSTIRHVVIVLLVFIAIYKRKDLLSLVNHKVRGE